MCEVRLVVWDVRDINFALLTEDNGGLEVEKSDLLVKCGIESSSYRNKAGHSNHKQIQDSDVHFQSGGYAEYNWRYCYNNIAVQRGLPLECELTVGLFENRLFSQDFLICESVLDLKPYLQYCATNQASFSIE